MNASEAKRPPRHPLVAGVVLAGGLSSRMGTEKAHIHAYGSEAPDMLARTRGLLQGVLDHVWVSCRPGNPKPHCLCVMDIYPGLGPFSGVHAALTHARAQGLEAVLALSCDLPFMDENTLRRLLSARRQRLPGTLMTTFRQLETDFIESLTAIYEVAALPLFETAKAAEIRKLSRIIPPERREDIVYASTEGLPFFNLNYPADLDVFRRMLAALQHQEHNPRSRTE